MYTIVNMNELGRKSVHDPCAFIYCIKSARNCSCNITGVLWGSPRCSTGSQFASTLSLLAENEGWLGALSSESETNAAVERDNDKGARVRQLPVIIFIIIVSVKRLGARPRFPPPTTLMERASGGR
jgi:hypothetical protein